MKKKLYEEKPQMKTYFVEEIFCRRKNHKYEEKNTNEEKTQMKKKHK